MTASRRLGLEQEFFVVDLQGESSDRADELIATCRQLASKAGLNSDQFCAEWVKNLLEIATPPAESVEQLARDYLQAIEIALAAATQLDLQLYPLSVYPLHLIPRMRDEANYHLQVRTVGHDAFLNAGKCAGTHLHLEAPAGVIDPQVGVALGSSQQDRDSLVNMYNLATSLDPVVIALSRACPFYEGRSTGLAHRTARYRGSRAFGWEGVYTELPAVGGLTPYADSPEHLVALQFARHYAWLEAMDAAEVERELYCESGATLLDSSWSPVRLNGHGTVEMRNMDSNYPLVVLALVQLLVNTAERVQHEGLRVIPAEGQLTFQVQEGCLLVPDFQSLSHHLLFEAVSEGIAHQDIRQLTQSVFDFAKGHHRQQETSLGDALSGLLPSLEGFQTTEMQLLEDYLPASEELSREKGLELVCRACEELRQQVTRLGSQLLCHD